jgi:hypothetical protein
MRLHDVSLLLALLLAPPARAELSQERLTQGKIAADLGRYDEAARAFATVAADDDTPPARRAESLIRLGAVRRAAGDFKGSVEAWVRASKEAGLDRDTKALLVEALGGAVPGAERWAEIWPGVGFVVDRSNPARPGLAIRWPDVTPAAARYAGDRLSLDVQDGDLLDVLRLFSELGKISVVADPGVRGRVTVKLDDVPWDQALDQILTTHRLASRREGDIVWVSAVSGLGTQNTYTGRPISLDFKNGDMGDLMRLFAHVSELNVVAPGVSGKVSLTLHETPWDKVLEIVLKMHGLVSRREGNVLWISSGWMPPARTYTGKAIDVELKDMSVHDALNEVARLGGGQVTLDPDIAGGPSTPPVTMALKQVPWDHALDLVARWGFLAIHGDGDPLTVRPIVRRGERPRGRGGLAQFAIRDVAVRGIVRHKSGYVALLLAPDGKTYFPRAGAALHDGKIQAIDATGVTFDEQAEGGPREVRRTLRTGSAGPPPPSTPAYTGGAIAVDYKDASLHDVFRLMADVSGLNVVVFPGVNGRTTFTATNMAWDEVLDRILAPHGLAHHREGQVVTIGPPARIRTAQRRAGAAPKYSGAPLDVDFKNEDLRVVLAKLAETGQASVTFDPRIQGRVTIRLTRVPWDQAFDVVVMTNGLAWERAGGSLRVSVP